MEQMAKDFALQSPLSEAYKKLPVPFMFPKDLLGTRMEYMWRLVLEGHDVLRRGDSLVTSLRFSPKDISDAEKGMRALGKLINNSRDFGWKDWGQLERLSSALGNILTYHLDKAVAYNKEHASIQDKTTNAKNAFVRACQDGNYTALAKLYPYSDGVLEIDDKGGLPSYLRGKMEIPIEWQIQQRASALKALFNHAESLNPQHVIFNLGKYETGVGDYALAALRQYRERNMMLYKDAKTMVEEFAQSLGQVSNDYLADVISQLCQIPQAVKLV